VFNNAGDVFNLCISTKENPSFTTVKIKAKAAATDIRVIFHITDILNDS